MNSENYTMKFDPEDPRITAYVLGELEGDEKEAIENLLADSPDARAFAESLGATAEALRGELAKEVAGAPVLGEEQREAVRSRIERGRFTPVRILGYFALAGALILAAWAVLVPNLQSSRLAERATPDSRATYGDTAAPHFRIYSTGGNTGLARDNEGWFGPIPEAEIGEGFRTEAYDRIDENTFRLVTQHPLSTFSIDVDTASYANVRRFLTQGQLPPRDAVRIEELINYFSYDDPAPAGDRPFHVNLEVAQCPWALEHRILRIGLKGREIPMADRPSSNLVFLLDVSGSMNDPNKLPLLKRGMNLLVESLGENDRVAIVVYAGASGLVLPSTSCEEKETILSALEKLQAGGSTNGGAGIQLAYDTAVQHFIPGGTNRVILCTDGDFNVGVSDRGSLTRLIEEKANSGVFLSVLGFGTGNIKDSQLEQLADRGNGNYAYIDSLDEARKVLVREMGSTLITIAKDVKLQIEFNPREVNAYRLIGYENRLLRSEDFNDDTKDAGEIGAGHSVTALYEIVPAGVDVDVPKVDPLRYSNDTSPSTTAMSGELLMVKLRYKEPEGETSQLLEFPLKDDGKRFDESSSDLRFATAVAAFGMILRDSEFKGSATLETVHELAADAIGEDAHGDRGAFLDLVRRAMAVR